jgi:AcrR family transcriptional regulator
MTEHRNGPVRSEAARESILAATARLFEQHGYDHLTIEGIAREAGVGKQTIYRWWKSRGALIAECLIEGRLLPVDFDVPNTGDLLADVSTWLTTVMSVLETPNGGALVRSLVAAGSEDAEVGDRLSASLGVDRSLSERLAIGIRDGQLPEGAPVDQLGQAILGTIILQALERRPASADSLQKLLRFLFDPDARPSR